MNKQINKSGIVGKWMGETEFDRHVWIVLDFHGNRVGTFNTLKEAKEAYPDHKVLN